MTPQRSPLRSPQRLAHQSSASRSLSRPSMETYDRPGNRLAHASPMPSNPVDNDSIEIICKSCKNVFHEPTILERCPNCGKDTMIMVDAFQEIHKLAILTIQVYIRKYLRRKKKINMKI